MERSIVESRGFRFSISNTGHEVGRAYLYIMTNDLHSKPFGLLEDVWVDPRCRGIGIGKKLVQTVIEEAHNQECYKLIATSRWSRIKVHELYKKIGFVDYGVEFRMNLSDL